MRLKSERNKSNHEVSMEDEYIERLAYNEKLAFIKIFCKLIKADGNVDTDEISFLRKIAARYNLDNSTIADIIKNYAQIDIKHETEMISCRKNALELVKELCVLANIDDDLHDFELDIIADIAQLLNIEYSKVILINRWVLDSMVLHRVGRIIMEKDNG